MGKLKSISGFWHRPLRGYTKALFIAYYLAVPFYVLWLATYFMNWDYPVTAAAFVFSETAIISIFVILMTICWRPKVRVIPPARPDLSVDVFITTYNEDLEVLRPSIRHCLAMDYPHETYVLDDGCRPEVKELAESMGAKYIGRISREHAKAGNLNNAMKYTSGDFIALFDADGIPKKNFLTELLGHFEDQKCAIVQANQMIYNFDSFQHSPYVQRDKFWNEQSIFWDIIQSGKDNLNGLTWCGSGSMLRRAAIEDVGGVAVDTVTEDFHTSIRLQAKGWKVVYHPAMLSYSLGPRDYESFMGQRNRWSIGILQTLKKEFKTLLGPSRLDFFQRVCAFSAISYIIESSVKVLTFILPGMILISGGNAINGNYLAIFALFQVWVFRGQMFSLVSRTRGSNRTVGAYWYMKMWLYLGNLAKAAFPLRVKFFVTPKQPFTVMGRPSLGAVLGVLYSVTCIVAACRLCLLGTANPGAIFAGVASVYHLSVCFSVVRLQTRGTWVKDSFAFLGCFPVQMKSSRSVEGAAAGTTRLVSRTEFWILGSHKFYPREIVHMNLILGDKKVSFSGKVVQQTRALAFSGLSIQEVKIRTEPLPAEIWDVIFDYCLEIGPDALIQRDETSLTRIPDAVRRVAYQSNTGVQELLPDAFAVST